MAITMGLTLIVAPPPPPAAAATPSEPVRGFSPSGVARVASDIEVGWESGTTISRNGRVVGLLDEQRYLSVVDRSGDVVTVDDDADPGDSFFDQPTADDDGDRFAVVFNEPDEEEVWEHTVELVEVDDEGGFTREQIALRPPEGRPAGRSIGSFVIPCADRPSIDASGRWIAMLYRGCGDDPAYQQDKYEEGIHVWTDDPEAPTFDEFVVDEPDVGYGQPEVPQITPDATEIVFAAPSSTTDARDVFVVDVVDDPDGATSLTAVYMEGSNRADSRNPSPSQFGDIVAFSSNATDIVSLPTSEQGRFHTYVLNRDPDGDEPPTVSLVSPYGTDEPTFPESVGAASGWR